MRQLQHDRRAVRASHLQWQDLAEQRHERAGIKVSLLCEVRDAARSIERRENHVLERRGYSVRRTWLAPPVFRPFAIFTSLFQILPGAYHKTFSFQNDNSIAVLDRVVFMAVVSMFQWGRGNPFACSDTSRSPPSR